MNNWHIFNSGGLLGLLMLISLVGAVVWCSGCVVKYVRIPYACVDIRHEKHIYRINIRNVVEETESKIKIKFYSNYNKEDMWIDKAFIVCDSQVWKKGDGGELVITSAYARWKGLL